MFLAYLDRKPSLEGAFRNTQINFYKNKFIFGYQTLFAWHWIFLPYVGSFCHVLDLFATLFGPQSGKKIQPPCN